MLPLVAPGSHPLYLCPRVPGPARRAVSAEVHLGDSVVALNGPWKFRAGDSPLDPVTNQPFWLTIL